MKKTQKSVVYASQKLTKVAPYLYRTKAGVYYGKIKREGKIHKKSLDTSDSAKAKRELKEFIKKIESKAVEVPDMTFEEVGKLWLESLYELKAKSKGRRETSYIGFKPYFKGRKLRTITKVDLQGWAKERSQERSARTFNIDRESLVLLMEYARKTLGIIETNHAKDLAKMKVKKTSVVPPTREQFTALMEFVDTSKRLNRENLCRHAGMFIRFLAFTGLRIEEAKHVLWKHIDFKNKTMLVTGGETGTKNYSQRTIPLFPAVRDLLADFTEQERQANSSVFAIDSAKGILKTASKAIGLPKGEHFGHHDMRHFFCSNAIELLVPDYVIASWLGHKDGGVLVKTTYGHLRKSYGDNEALKMTYVG